MMKHIFDYNNYREYLQEYYEYHKVHTVGFSWREFSKLCGYKSPVFIKLIVENKTNLSAEGIEKIIDALNFEGRERTYFRILVNFNQAKDSKSKKNYFEELRDFAGQNGTKILGAEQYDYYNSWVNAAVREKITLVKNQNDYKALGAMLIPPQGSRVVSKSIKLLEELDLIVKNENGRYIQTDSKISTGSEVLSLAVRETHKQMANLALDAIDNIPKEERDISGLTIGVSEVGMKIIKQEITELRKKVVKIVECDEGADRVMRLNLQLFPLSNPENVKIKARKSRGKK